MTQGRARLPDLMVARSYMTLTDQGPHEGVDWDLSVIHQLIEQMIVFSPGELLVEDTSIWAPAVRCLTGSFRSWVREVPTEPVVRAMEGIFSTVYADFGLELIDWAGTTMGRAQVRPFADIGSDRQKLADHHLFKLLPELYPLFFGIQYNVPAEVPLRRVLKRLRILRALSNRTEASHNLAVVESVLTSYGQLNVDGVRLNSRAPISSDRLRMVIEDTNYQELALASYDLGLPGQASIAMTRMKELVLRFISRPQFKAVLEWGNTSLNTRGIPSIPTKGMFGITDVNYFPPLVEYEHVRKDAVAMWLIRNPVPFPHPDGKVPEDSLTTIWGPAGSVEPTYMSSGRVDDPTDT